MDTRLEAADRRTPREIRFAIDRFAYGKSDDDVIRELRRNGRSEREAVALVQKARRERMRRI